MTYEKPEQPPPLTPRRTAASGVPRAASFFFANSTALSEMVISRRGARGSLLWAGASCSGVTVAVLVSMAGLGSWGSGVRRQRCARGRGRGFAQRGARGALLPVVFDRALD